MRGSDIPYRIKWDSVLSILAVGDNRHGAPAFLHGLEYNYVISVLKKALVVYGQDGELNKFTPHFIVEFDF